MIYIWLADATDIESVIGIASKVPGQSIHTVASAWKQIIAGRC